MKGIVFTEFIEMIEKEHGIAVTENIIESAAVPNSGAYTSVGNYPHKEMVDLIVALSKQTGQSAEDLMIKYGRYLFGRLAKQYPSMVDGFNDPFSILEQIHSHIHVEVKKLYPDTNPPSLIAKRVSNNELHLIYSSHRRMAPVAEGLILGCGDYYNISLKISKKMIDVEKQVVEFIITK